jgi:hypothetical protein
LVSAVVLFSEGQGPSSNNPPNVAVIKTGPEGDAADTEIENRGWRAGSRFRVDSQVFDSKGFYVWKKFNVNNRRSWLLGVDRDDAGRDREPTIFSKFSGSEIKIKNIT